MPVSADSPALADAPSGPGLRIPDGFLDLTDFVQEAIEAHGCVCVPEQPGDWQVCRTDGEPFAHGSRLDGYSPEAAPVPLALVLGAAAAGTEAAAVIPGHLAPRQPGRDPGLPALAVSRPGSLVIVATPWETRGLIAVHLQDGRLQARAALTGIPEAIENPSPEGLLELAVRMFGGENGPGLTARRGPMIGVTRHTAACVKAFTEFEYPPEAQWDDTGHCSVADFCGGEAEARRLAAEGEADLQRLGPALAVHPYTTDMPAASFSEPPLRLAAAAGARFVSAGGPFGLVHTASSPQNSRLTRGLGPLGCALVRPYSPYAPSAQGRPGPSISAAAWEALDDIPF